jgi:hypothetical protein
MVDVLAHARELSVVEPSYLIRLDVRDPEGGD